MSKKVIFLFIIISLFFSFETFPKTKQKKTKKKASYVRYIRQSVPVEILGVVCYVDGKNITFYLGQIDGIKENDVLSVIREKKRVGKIKVVWAGKSFSLGRLLTDEEIKLGDLVSNIPTFPDQTEELPKKQEIEKTDKEKIKPQEKTEEKVEEKKEEKVVKKTEEKKEISSEKQEKIQPEDEKKSSLPGQGKIYLIYDEWVEINLGTEQGIKDDCILNIVRGDKTIGKIQIIRAGLFSSTGKVISLEKGENIFRGDTVILP